MSQIVALVIIGGILFIGESVSTATKAWIPSVFVSAILFIAGYWTFFPADLVPLSGITPTVATLAMYLLITNMGTMLSIKELIKQWRTIVIALAGIVGIVIFLLTIGVAIFDWETVITVTPPLTGGIVSALIMQEAAIANGYATLGVLAISIFVLQGFAGYPLTALMLKREAEATLTLIRKDEWQDVQADPALAAQGEDKKEDVSESLPRLFAHWPEAYHTPFFMLTRIFVVALFAHYTSLLLAPVIDINELVLCLVFGVLAKAIGWLEEQPLEKANAFGLCLFILMAFIFDGLSEATPEMLTELITPIVGTVVIGVSGMGIISWIFAKWLRVSPRLAFAVSLTALYGFPANYIITQEIIMTVSQDEREQELLTNYLMPPMLVGGFVTVTMVSVVLAGIFVNLY